MRLLLLFLILTSVSQAQVRSYFYPATAAEIAAGVSNTRGITPKGLADANFPTPPTTATAGEINAGTVTNKYASPQAIGASNLAFLDDIPVKATGAEINTGTDDAKFATPKAIADSNVAFLSDIPTVPTSASVTELEAGTELSKWLTPYGLRNAIITTLGYVLPSTKKMTLGIGGTHYFYWSGSVLRIDETSGDNEYLYPNAGGSSLVLGGTVQAPTLQPKLTHSGSCGVYGKEYLSGYIDNLFQRTTNPSGNTDMRMGGTKYATIAVTTGSTTDKTVYLPAPAANIDGFETTVIKVDTGTKNVIIDSDTGNTINGVQTWTSSARWDMMTVRYVHGLGYWVVVSRLGVWL